MAKSIKKLRDDLTILETETRLLATELYELSHVYLQRLHNVVSKQLVFVCYQICTHKYPEQFLVLTYGEKVDLQEKIKAKGAVFLSHLTNTLEEMDKLECALFPDFPHSLTGLPAPSTPSEDANLQLIEKEELSNINPGDIINFFAEIEYSVGETLKEISISTNNFLREYKILPAQIPSKILAMALENSEAAVGGSDGDNLINLIVEKEHLGSDETKDITPIVAVCLRLSEIEFNDPELRTQRPSLLAIMDKLITIEKKYSRLDRQHKIALAESQWRSCWNEE
ncbi:MAG: hypothetical protein IGQ45_08725 [Cyanobacterium sp. T60_A2020_053]|nr:hypothetical protein [Cyanobacterium sp. T60_A2020_053]